MSDLTLEKIEEGKRDLEIWLFQPSVDEWYSIRERKSGLQYVQRAQTPVEISSVAQCSAHEICVFTRQISYHLRSREHDQPERCRLGKAIQYVKTIPEDTIVHPEEHPELTRLGCAPLKAVPMKALYDSLRQRRRSLQPTEIGAMRVDGIQILRQAAEKVGLMLFQYHGDAYFTECPETHGFLADLDHVIAYEMLRSVTT